MAAQVITALDTDSLDKALTLADKLRSHIKWFKVGSELFVSAGPESVLRLKEKGFNVFLDLKFFDIPNTVAKAVSSAVSCGADIIDLHILGGARMMQAALEARDKSTTGTKPLLIGVTVLTSMDEKDMRPLAVLQTIDNNSTKPSAGAEDVLQTTVQALAGRAMENGLDGVVASGLEVAAIKQHCGDDCICIVPGIRPRSLDDDQRRIMTPQDAVKAGADFLVVGRPITAAPEPEAAAEKIASEATSPDPI